MHSAGGRKAQEEEDEEVEGGSQAETADVCWPRKPQTALKLLPAGRFSVFGFRFTLLSAHGTECCAATATATRCNLRFPALRRIMSHAREESNRLTVHFRQFAELLLNPLNLNSQLPDSTSLVTDTSTAILAKLNLRLYIKSCKYVSESRSHLINQPID